MKLSRLLEGVPVAKMFQTMFGRMVVTHDVEVNRIQYDSRRVGPGDCFVAIRGSAIDGHRYTQDAMAMGAKVLVVQDDAAAPDSLCMHQGVAKIVVMDSRKALAVMSANLYGHPSRKLRVIGVTGTNGKTTTTHLVRSILEAAGETVGLIGTIDYRIGAVVIPATHTTPESLELNELLARMVDAGCTSVSMEVSSHALDQSRVYGIEFQTAVFTNLTQDHLDYHGTMDEYFKAKQLLFESLPEQSWSIINTDDDWGRKILAVAKSQTMTYGFTSSAHVRASHVHLSIEQSIITIDHKGHQGTIFSPLVGRFNVSNTLAAAAVGVSRGLPLSTIQKGLERVTSVKGRFERITSPREWSAIIDYAHTPDALEKCLKAIHEVREKRGRILVVFGAGGDRDKTKRPLMGKIASELADVCFVTSDNPRTEDPTAIITDILKGIKEKARVKVQSDRRLAIQEALGMAKPGDVVLIAGKGHEEYQVVGQTKIHFSDREVVEEFAASQS